VPSRPFQLTRYFTITSLVAFAVLGGAVTLLQRGEERFFEQVQREQAALAAQVQADLLQEQKANARAGFIAVHEAAHVTLAKVFANALWSSHFAPLVAQAQAVPVEPCRLASEGSSPEAQQAQQACIARSRARVTALPAFASVDAPVRELMRTTTVFKIKVYDLRGLTVYSSELAQVGEDKADNGGWRAAAAGRAASELVHRNQFSAFEGVVKDRNLIQSYIPVAAPGGGVAGVLEIYSDVSPLLEQLEASAARATAVSARERARMGEAAARNQELVESASTRFISTIVGLLVFTFLVLLFFVRRGQGIIDGEARAREQAALREQEWHRDKMATMGAMASNISHEVGNPLAIISGLAEEIGQWRDQRDIHPEFPRMIVEQTTRIAAMTRRINDFAQPGRDTPQPLDAGELVRGVADFLKFDRRFHGTPIELRLAGNLPACHGVPDHLTEALMGLLQAFEQACTHCTSPGARLIVETSYLDAEVSIRISGFCGDEVQRCPFPMNDPRLESARRRVEAMGGRLDFAGAVLAIHLRCVSPEAGAAAGGVSA
jgi:signal transduction histidine kinase